MIEHMQINGREATVAYIQVGKNGEFIPVDKIDATAAKILYSDGGDEFVVVNNGAFGAVISRYTPGPGRRELIEALFADDGIDYTDDMLKREWEEIEKEFEDLQKEWDESEHPRDDSGKFSSSPGGGSKLAGPKWLTRERIMRAMGKATPVVKDVAAATVATLVTQFNNNDMDTAIVKESITNMSSGLKMSRNQALQVMKDTIQALQKMRGSEVDKAMDDTTDKFLSKLMVELNAIDFGPEEHVEISKIEDRVLVLQDKIDHAKNMFKKG